MVAPHHERAVSMDKRPALEDLHFPPIRLAVKPKLEAEMLPI
jgi:hypothetical protein